MKTQFEKDQDYRSWICIEIGRQRELYDQTLDLYHRTKAEVLEESFSQYKKMMED